MTSSSWILNTILVLWLLLTIFLGVWLALAHSYYIKMRDRKELLQSQLENVLTQVPKKAHKHVWLFDAYAVKPSWICTICKKRVHKNPKTGHDFEHYYGP